MVERLEILLKSRNLSPAQLADEIGIQRSGIYHIMKGRNKPGFDFITKLLEHFPEISADWLLMGKGSMVKNVSESVVEEPQISRKSETISSRSGYAKTESAISQSVKSKTTPKSSKDQINRIEKIVVFYDDKTFSEYRPQ